MSQIEVKKIIKALNASDGAGAKLKEALEQLKQIMLTPF